MLRSLLALVLLACALAPPADASTTRRTHRNQTQAQRHRNFIQNQHHSHRPAHHHPGQSGERPWH